MPKRVSIWPVSDVVYKTGKLASFGVARRGRREFDGRGGGWVEVVDVAAEPVSHADSSSVDHGDRYGGEVREPED